MQQLLQQPQGTEPAADRAAQNQAIEHENAVDIEADLLVRGADGVLQGTQRAGAHRAGAGIAVEARHADSLCGGGFALIDFALHKALDVGVVEQRAVELYKPSLGRTVGSPPGAFYIIQGQHTPYKF